MLRLNQSTSHIADYGVYEYKSINDQVKLDNEPQVCNLLELKFEMVNLIIIFSNVSHYLLCDNKVDFPNHKVENDDSDHTAD